MAARCLNHPPCSAGEEILPILILGNLTLKPHPQPILTSLFFFLIPSILAPLPPHPSFYRTLTMVVAYGRLLLPSSKDSYLCTACVKAGENLFFLQFCLLTMSSEQIQSNTPSPTAQLHKWKSTGSRSRAPQAHPFQSSLCMATTEDSLQWLAAVGCCFPES